MKNDHSTDENQQKLLDELPPPEEFLFVNSRCCISEQDQIRVVVVNGTPVYRYVRGDIVAEDLFVAQALSSGFASSYELAKALGREPRTLQRRRNRLESEGVEGLVPKKRGPKGQRLTTVQDALIRKLHKKGLSERGIGRTMKLAEVTIGRARRRLGLLKLVEAKEQPVLLKEVENPGTEPPDEQVKRADEADRSSESTVEEHQNTPISSPPETLPEPRCGAATDRTLDTDPMNRCIDRNLAAQRLLLDAVPLFAPGNDIPRLGALLAIPFIVLTGVFEESEKLYGNIGPSFYGLRTTLLALVLFALLRVKSVESLKEYSPPDLGRVLGLDRAPEVKTLRRKLKTLAAGPSEVLADRLAQRRARRDEEALGFLYVDGHVRVYSGKNRLPKAHVTRMRISLPASQDVWVNDANGLPVLFVTQEAHPSLTTAMEGLMSEIRSVVGDNRRVTVVFDRGGWSPKLFKKMSALGFDVMTYRKGTGEVLQTAWFLPYPAPGAYSGKTWLLHDVSTWVGGESDGLWMRQVTRLKDDHQTQVLTTRQDLETVEVAHRMFSRWQQENFFKYMRDEYAIDALVEYGSEEEDPRRDIPNPAWQKADRALKQGLKELKKLEADYGAYIAAAGGEKATIVEVESTSSADMLRSIAGLRTRAESLHASRDALPRRIVVGDLSDAETTVRLPARLKRFSDAMKMLAYQVETDLLRSISQIYPRSAEEGRTLITSALHGPGDLAIIGDELHVTLHSMSSPHRSRAVAELCSILNATETRFPGTSLRLRYSIR